jgi:hypothetical protein
MLRYWLALLGIRLKWRVVAPAVVAYSAVRGEEYSSTSALLVDYGVMREEERLD